MNIEINMKKILLIALTLFISASIFADDVRYLTTEQFKQLVFDYSNNKTWHYQGDKPCIIDFYTTWCGPCKRLAPIMQELAEEYCDKVVIYKVDTEQERELAAVFGISSIPTLLFCPMGENPQVTRGLLPKETLERVIKEVLHVSK